LDLTQAEAVMDLIHAKTDRAHAAASRTLEGHLSAKVNHARDELIKVLAHLEAHIDFPEDDIQPKTLEGMRADLEHVTSQMRRLLSTAREGRILRQGISVAIVGRPNVGKSSLMNALLGHDRAIVTSIPGTTRDTIEDYANIGGIPVRLTDTAGIRRARGAVEELGIKRSQQLLATCDMVLHVIDVSRPFAASDNEIAESYAGRPAILVVNKTDLPSRAELPASITSRSPVGVSATEGKGLELLRERMTQLMSLGGIGSQDEDVFINERHASALESAIKTLTILTPNFPTLAPEVIAQELRYALDQLGEIVGKTTTEDILNKVFSSFCIGK
jgi:tRNA modification GTPase